MWHYSVCNTVQEPTVKSTIVAKKTTTWGESGFPSEFLGQTRFPKGNINPAFEEVRKGIGKREVSERVRIPQSRKGCKNFAEVGSPRIEVARLAR